MPLATKALSRLQQTCSVAAENSASIPETAGPCPPKTLTSKGILGSVLSQAKEAPCEAIQCPKALPTQVDNPVKETCAGPAARSGQGSRDNRIPKDTPSCSAVTGHRNSCGCRLPRSRPAVRQRGTGTSQVRGQACNYQAEVCSATGRTTRTKEQPGLGHFCLAGTPVPRPGEILKPATRSEHLKLKGGMTPTKVFQYFQHGAFPNSIPEGRQPKRSGGKGGAEPRVGKPTATVNSQMPGQRSRKEHGY